MSSENLAYPISTSEVETGGSTDRSSSGVLDVNVVSTAPSTDNQAHLMSSSGSQSVELRAHSGEMLDRAASDVTEVRQLDSSVDKDVMVESVVYTATSSVDESNPLLDTTEEASLLNSETANSETANSETANSETAESEGPNAALNVNNTATALSVSDFVEEHPRETTDETFLTNEPVTDPQTEADGTDTSGGSLTEEETEMELTEEPTDGEERTDGEEPTDVEEPTDLEATDGEEPTDGEEHTEEEPTDGEEHTEEEPTDGEEHTDGEELDEDNITEDQTDGEGVIDGVSDSERIVAVGSKNMLPMTMAVGAASVVAAGAAIGAYHFQNQPERVAHSGTFEASMVSNQATSYSTTAYANSTTSRVVPSTTTYSSQPRTNFVESGALHSRMVPTPLGVSSVVSQPTQRSIVTSSTGNFVRASEFEATPVRPTTMVSERTYSTSQYPVQSGTHTFSSHPMTISGTGPFTTSSASRYPSTTIPFSSTNMVSPITQTTAMTTPATQFTHFSPATTNLSQHGAVTYRKQTNDSGISTRHHSMVVSKTQVTEVAQPIQTITTAYTTPARISSKLEAFNVQTGSLTTPNIVPRGVSAVSGAPSADFNSPHYSQMNATPTFLVNGGSTTHFGLPSNTGSAAAPYMMTYAAHPAAPYMAFQAGPTTAGSISQVSMRQDQVSVKEEESLLQQKIPKQHSQSSRAIKAAKHKKCSCQC